MLLRYLTVALAALIAVLLASCNSELPQVTTVRQAISSAPREDGPVRPPPPRQIELELEHRVRLSGCTLRFIRLPGRPVVLQLTSYADPLEESFPSFFLRATVPVESKEPALHEFVGKSAQALAYFQPVLEAAIWRSAADRPLAFTLSSVSGDRVAGEFSGTMVNLETGEEKPIAGSFVGTSIMHTLSK